MNTSLSPADDDAWTIAEGKSGEAATMIRYRPNLSDFTGRNNFPQRIIISWSFDYLPDHGGFPTDDQSDEMKNLEDILIENSEKNELAILSFVYTSQGIREWNFYIKNIEEFSEVLNSSLQPGLPIEISVEEDPEWKEYFSVLNMCEPQH